MSNFSGYKTKSFSNTQKFFVLDPNTGSPSFVNAADLVSQLTPNSNYVYAERTRTTAQATDYDVGSLVQTAGDTAVADNGAAYFLVVASGGDFVMDNGNELLFLYDDDLLRSQLANNTVTLGSDLVAHTGTTDTVTDALDKLISVQINNQTGTTYTLQLSDNNKWVRLANAAAITVTVPDNATVPFPVGANISLIQSGAGTVTVSPAAGVTVNSADSLLDTRAQYSTMTLTKVAADEWDLAGDIA